LNSFDPWTERVPTWVEVVSSVGGSLGRLLVGHRVIWTRQWTLRVSSSHSPDHPQNESNLKRKERIV